MISVVTNIDADHLGSYEGDLGRLKQGFLDFLNNLPFYGLAVLCSDDDNTRDLIPQLGRVSRATASASAPTCAPTTSSGSVALALQVVSKERREPLVLEVNLAGLHNVLNSLAAVAVAAELEISDAALKRALAEFAGVERRLQVNGTVTTAPAA